MTTDSTALNRETRNSPPSSAKLVVCISGNGSNLQAIIDACLSGSLTAQVSAVISNNDKAYGLERARNANIETICIDHRQFPTRDAFDHRLLETALAYQPDLVVLAGFMRILSADFVQRLHGKLVNIHPSLLPKYRGLNTHSRALEAGERVHGCSVHFVTEELDGGPIIGRTAVAIDPTDTPDSLATKVQQAEHRLYPVCLQWIVTQRVRFADTDDNKTLLWDNNPMGDTGIDWTPD